MRRHRTVDEAALRRHAGLSARGLARLLADDLVRLAADGARRGAAGEAPPTLLPEQEAALGQILAATGRGEPVLLHGVTGSGKTEVYLRAAEAVLRSGHGVLILVPEIGLTGQTIARLAARFPGEQIAVFHSGLSAGERLAAWRAAAEGRARLVLGARSAVLAPIRDLGLIVVDEEHDASYKQDNDPRYDARTVAAWRAARTGAALVLGSATPTPRDLRAHRAPRRPAAARRRLRAAGPRGRRPARRARTAVATALPGHDPGDRGRRQGDPVPEPARLRLAAGLQPLRPHLDVPELRRGPRLLRARRPAALPHLRLSASRARRVPDLPEHGARSLRLRHRGSRARGGGAAAGRGAAATRLRRRRLVLAPLRGARRASPRPAARCSWARR